MWIPIIAISLPLGFYLGKNHTIFASQLQLVNPAKKDVKPIPLDLNSYENTLARLLTFEPEQLEGIDIAVLNLACGQGFEESKAFSIQEGCEMLDRVAEHVKKELKRGQHLYDKDPKTYHGSRAYFSALLMVCTLQEDAGFHYRKERIFDYDYTEAGDSLILGLLGPKRAGTCASMPVLYVAVGRRLGFPMKLVSARGHLFARWESPDGRQRFNIEGSGHGMSSYSDDHYKEWPYPVTESDVVHRNYLKSMTSAEEFALFLEIRGSVLDAQGKWPQAKLALAQAATYNPNGWGRWAPLALLAHKESLAKTGILDPNNPKNPYRNALPPPVTQVKDLVNKDEEIKDKDAYRK